ncbi:MAG: AAA domain-containing protein [Bacilli bacterium]|nr:AAA domain-containing protein [Bacilli bacterium]
MKRSIKSIIYQAVVEKKWLDVWYTNKSGGHTHYCIGIKDISSKDGKIFCDIFNCYTRNNELIDSDRIFINVSGIKNASILDQSFYPTPIALLERVDKEQELINYLEVATFDNDILRYLSDCYRMDSDPYIKNPIMIDGIDIRELQRDRIYKLNDSQFNKIINDVFKNKKRLRYSAEDLAINSFSIDIGGKQYVVAYYSLALNFKDRTLKVADHPTINKSFLIEERKVSLSSYLDMSPDDFANNYEHDKLKYIELIKQNFSSNEKVNTRPTFFLLERNIHSGVDAAFQGIEDLDGENKLTHPIKSFFGRSRCKVNNNIKDTQIVAFDKKKINIDQMRVVYNSMLNHVTFVKGPPGTGKTETIFNVLLSAYTNNKTVLVCSNNNHPVDDIYAKMASSLLHNKKYKMMFPIIRLGNNEEMKNSILRLREFLDFANMHANTRNNKKMTEMSKNKSLEKFKALRLLLLRYEDRVNRIETIERLRQIKNLSSSCSIKKEIDIRLSVENGKLNDSKKLENRDVAEYCISAAEDADFQNYLYYSSMSHIKNLLYSSYDKLKEIILIDSLDEAVVKLNKFLKDDKNLAKFLKVFPIVICTNLSCDKLGTAKPQFDLCIMDEAGQCNIASSLIPIVRADNLLLVGDTNQLQPVTVIEQQVNEKLKEKYNINDDYDYVKNSILSSMLRKDKNSKSILLRYHYRCARNIADFSNKRFYNDQLKLINSLNGNLTYYNIKNRKTDEERNSYQDEAKLIVKIIKDNKYADAAVITPFVNQANLINSYLKQSGITTVKAGTIHTLQGSEKSTIIMSAALSTKTAKKTMDWIKNNHELINVGVTRAKKDLIFVGDKEAIDVLSKNDKEDSDIKALSDYVYSKGKTVVPKSSVVISTDFSNNSESEREFFKTIAPYFNNERRKNKIRVVRNLSVKDAVRHIRPEDHEIIGNKEFDVVVQVKSSNFQRFKTIVVFEIDGGEHVGSKQTAMRDREKEKICKYYGISLIRIANSQIKDYELIIRLFESVAMGVKDIEDKYVQISLFED